MIAIVSLGNAAQCCAVLMAETLVEERLACKGSEEARAAQGRRG